MKIKVIRADLLSETLKSERRNIKFKILTHRLDQGTDYQLKKTIYNYRRY